MLIAHKDNFDNIIFLYIVTQFLLNKVNNERNSKSFTQQVQEKVKPHKIFLLLNYWANKIVFLFK